MTRNVLARTFAAALVATAYGTLAHGADPWADKVISYASGTGFGFDFNSGAPFTDPDAALGEPTRFSSSLPESAPVEYGGIVTPMQAAFRSTEVVTIGNGGWLILKFDEPVTNDPLNPFGIDLLVFGNSFYLTDASGAAASLEHDGGHLEVSADGVTFFDIFGEVDGQFPTNAYVDASGPYSQTPGSIPSDFTRPVNPAFDPLGKTFGEILAGYGSSGGGFGVDIGPTGLSSISYVRFSAPFSTGPLPEIDGLADVSPVPEPTAAALTAVALILLGKNARARTV